LEEVRAREASESVHRYYADDLVICSRGKAAEALVTMRDMMIRLKLMVNQTKTRVCKVPEEKFDFLGFSALQKVHGYGGLNDLSGS
jgi:hypothetical protein